MGRAAPWNRRPSPARPPARSGAPEAPGAGVCAGGGRALLDLDAQGAAPGPRARGSQGVEPEGEGGAGGEEGAGSEDTGDEGAGARGRRGLGVRGWRAREAPWARGHRHSQQTLVPFIRPISGPHFSHCRLPALGCVCTV